MSMKNLKIAIIGCGPGGLSLARLLQCEGFNNVHIYEREINRNYRIQGSSLDLHKETGLKVVEKSKLLDKFKTLSRTEGESVMYMDKMTNVRLSIPPLKIMPSKPEIDRGDLRDLFLDSLKDDTIKWNHHFIGLKPSDNGWNIDFKSSGSNEVMTEYADLVIGADGANSKVRPYITDTKPDYSGVTLIELEINDLETKIPKIYNWCNQGLFYAVSDEKGICVQARSDKSYIIYFTAKKPFNWVKDLNLDLTTSEKMKSYLKEDYATWNSIFHELIDKSNNHFQIRPIYELPPNQKWQSKSNITIIGDAAHVMSPFAGQGVNSAMMDALVLANSLVEYSDRSDNTESDVTNAIKSYEKEMLSRTSETANITLEAKETLHSANVLNIIPQKRLGSFYFLSPILPYMINSLNYLTDLFGFTKK